MGWNSCADLKRSPNIEFYITWNRLRIWCLPKVTNGRARTWMQITQLKMLYSFHWTIDLTLSCKCVELQLLALSRSGLFNCQVLQSPLVLIIFGCFQLALTKKKVYTPWEDMHFTILLSLSREKGENILFHWLRILTFTGNFNYPQTQETMQPHSHQNTHHKKDKQKD